MNRSGIIVWILAVNIIDEVKLVCRHRGLSMLIFQYVLWLMW